MTTEQNDKALRLDSALKEALQPLLAKIDTLEQEVTALKVEQQELQQLLREKS